MMPYPPQGLVTPDEFITHTADLDAHIASFMQKSKTGKYFIPFPISAINQRTLTADRIYAVPFIVARDLTIDRLAIEVITGDAGKIARLGIYEDDGSLYPGDLVQDYGTVSVAAIAVVAASADQSLTKGLYWLVVVSDGTPEIRCYFPVFSVLGSSATDFSEAQQIGHYYKNAVGSGALDDPFVGGAILASVYNTLILPRLKTLD